MFLDSFPEEKFFSAVAVIPIGIATMIFVKGLSKLSFLSGGEMVSIQTRSRTETFQVVDHPLMHIEGVYDHSDSEGRAKGRWKTYSLVAGSKRLFAMKDQATFFSLLEEVRSYGFSITDGGVDDLNLRLKSVGISKRRS